MQKKNNYEFWRRIFLVSLGLFAGTAFCMKWMEGDFLQDGQKFTILGLEISYGKEKVAAILGGLNDQVKTILRYHLSFDFAFMSGVYPGIAALCMMARNKSTGSGIRIVLLVLALLQLVAWGCDIYENCCLFRWINKPAIGNEFNFYHLLVSAKWIIAITGTLLAIPFALGKRAVLRIA